MQHVLVTGGSGSFGKAFVRRVLDTNAAESVRILSRDEAKQAQMRVEFNDPRLRFLIGDVRDSVRVRWAIRGCDTVVHAAALKRVETGEANPREFVATNITGTENVTWACLEQGVSRCVFLSTDKAASPNTLYGMTKAVAERLWTQSNVYAAGTPTRFSATRYGNVIGSRGSVIPFWREQARAGELTVTDPTMSRFWMTMDDAVDLVLLAIGEMRGGEVFVPRIGAAPLATVAEAVAPGCTHRVVGNRGAEKQHEELIGADEAPYTHDAGTHFVIEPAVVSWEDRTPSPHPRVRDGFRYTSDTARTLTVPELRRMIA